MTRSATGAVVAAALVGVWAVGVTVVLQVAGWLVDQLLVVYAGDLPWWAWPVTSLTNAVLVAVPAALLAFIPRSAVVRGVGRAWLAGAIAVGLLGAVRAVPAAEAELQLFLVAAIMSLGAWSARSRVPYPVIGKLAAVAGGLLVLLPWLWFGALGGVLESLLALAAAAAVGWLAATILEPGFWAGFEASRALLVIVGGLAAGVALLLVAAGAGASGTQLALMLVLAPLGFAAAALPGPRRAVGLLVGFASFGPLALVDPEEISLLLATGRDLPFWAGLATAGSLGLGLLLGLGYGFGLWRDWRRPVAAAAAGVVALAAVGVYARLGQPGLHGERLFVVMAGQADLSGLPAGTGQAGRDARAAEVYRRLVAHAEAGQADLRAELDRLQLPYTPYYLVNAIEVAGAGPELRVWLSGRADVDRVLVSQRLRPLPAPGSPMSGVPGLTPDDPEWNVELVRADRVWDELGVTGEGIVVGSSDSGVDGEHPALAGGFRGGGDSWLDPWNGTGVPTDRNGHGTHTLGSAVGRAGIGVAPGARWAGCTNLDRGLGNPGHYLDCLQFMLAPYPPGGDPRDGRPERAPHILTNSWGCPPIEGCDSRVLRPAVAALRAAGLYLVVAAGNAGPFCGSIEDPPSAYPEVFTVGAVDRDERLAAFSSRGPVPGGGKPDLVAPGARVVSAMPGGGYAALDGTSMATPHVAGVVALMWSAEPALIGDVDTTGRILRETARPVEIGDDPACGGEAALVGAGLVDAHAAVAAALARS
jgi:subtilisin family serine protease